MKKSFIAFIVLAVSLAIISSAYAFQPDDRQDMHKKFCFKKYLNLSDEQMAKMKELKNSFRNDTRDLRYSLEIKRIEMRKLFTDPKTDDATLLAKQKEINDIRQQFMEKKAQMKIDWRKILTPEQIAKLDKIHHKCHMKGWKHNKRAGGDL